jgi:nucleotide-binding universal stress UspA family protein
MMNQVPLTPASEPSARSQDSGRKARDDGGSLYKVILVPIDFSECSNRTLQFATHIAIRENANIWLLHVFRVPDYAVTQFGWGPEDCRSAEQEAQANLIAVEKEVLSRGIKAKACFRVGHPFEEIVSMANDPEVDLVLIGSHGCSAIKQLLLGSTVARVVERARCPVLVVKERFPSA